ncbi:MAG: hypothetical protein D084_Lepto4C00285G0002 [Leptospirillum sp. Group IV 'UBA BS']|nr:MAG: hypothetical protein D084_Lepto4C00285G0002 [Leptospirillum sp. Group IV 'UBA BS']
MWQKIGLLFNLKAYESGAPPTLRGLDPVPAAQLIRKAALQGNARAQFNLGLLHLKGKGVPQDLSQAALWFERAAEQGLAAAQFNLGLMLFEGRRIPQSLSRGSAYIKQAARQGMIEAKSLYGTLYLEARILPDEDIDPVEWIEEAAHAGDIAAQFNLGLACRPWTKPPQGPRKSAPLVPEGGGKGRQPRPVPPGPSSHARGSALLESRGGARLADAGGGIGRSRRPVQYRSFVL